MDIDSNDPIWTVQHLAAVLHLHPRDAAALTRSPGFPLPREGFPADLWTRAEILTWFAARPGRVLEPITPAVSDPEPPAQAPASRRPYIRRNP